MYTSERQSVACEYFVSYILSPFHSNCQYSSQQPEIVFIVSTNSTVWYTIYDMLYDKIIKFCVCLLINFLFTDRWYPDVCVFGEIIKTFLPDWRVYCEQFFASHFHHCVICRCVCVQSIKSHDEFVQVLFRSGLIPIFPIATIFTRIFLLILNQSNVICDSWPIKTLAMIQCTHIHPIRHDNTFSVHKRKRRKGRRTDIRLEYNLGALCIFNASLSMRIDCAWERRSIKELGAQCIYEYNDRFMKNKSRHACTNIFAKYDNAKGSFAFESLT